MIDTIIIIIIHPMIQLIHQPTPNIEGGEGIGYIAVEINAKGIVTTVIVAMVMVLAVVAVGDVFIVLFADTVAVIIIIIIMDEVNPYCNSHC